MVVSKLGTEITVRFFLAVDTLIAQGKLRSLRQFTIMYGLNYGNTYTLRNTPSFVSLKAELVANLCNDFGVSADYVLLGIEPMFKKTKRKANNK